VKSCFRLKRLWSSSSVVLATKLAILIKECCLSEHHYFFNQPAWRRAKKQHLVTESFSAFHIYRSDHLQPLRTSSRKISIYYLLIRLSLYSTIGDRFTDKKVPANENRQRIDNRGLM